MGKLDAGELLRQARTEAGLSQRALARRARTAQSVVARIETGENSPSTETLARLLAAAGFEASVSLSPKPAARTHMLADVARILALTPEDRIREVAAAARFVAAARRV